MPDEKENRNSEVGKILKQIVDDVDIFVSDVVENTKKLRDNLQNLEDLRNRGSNEDNKPPDSTNK